MTFHYSLLPQHMLVSLIESRSKVPFPPIFEALFLEFIIELLREAGTRLPTKVGQTMGIVGGMMLRIHCDLSNNEKTLSTRGKAV